LITAIASGVPGYSLPAPFQGGKGQDSSGDIQAQRNQQYDQQQQQQQQQQALDDLMLRQRSEDLDQLQFRIWQLDAERIRLKEALRENFRRHYAVIRRDADELVQLASSLQTSLETNEDPAVARDMMTKAARMQKLAHEVRSSMGGGRVPKAKPLAASAPGMAGAGDADSKQPLVTNVSSAKAAAALLKSSVEEYLASDNEQAVSVSALLRTANKDRFDPNSLAILKSSLQLEQYARKIRSELRELNAVR
jgi:hypothetical protein